MAGPDQRFLFSDIDLARRLERAEARANAAFVEARAAVDPQSGARWIEAGGAYAMYDGVSSPVTQTFGLGLFADATSAVLDRIEAFFRERGAPVCHEVSPLAGVPLAALLAERGYRPVEFSSVTYRAMDRGGALGLSLNENIHVRPVEQHEGELWAQVSAKGWSEDFPGVTDFLLALGAISTRRAHTISFLAELEGRPIGAGALCVHQGVALFAGACTIPEARRQGAQRALMDARFRYAAEHGCDVAMMGAAPGSASQRNAERYGFRIAYTRTKWQLSHSSA
ncbi:MAG: GNAT family N-acetyltransferase [Bryobacterales bacterium]